MFRSNVIVIVFQSYIKSCLYQCLRQCLCQYLLIVFGSASVSASVFVNGVCVCASSMTRISSDCAITAFPVNCNFGRVTYSSALNYECG